jgi:hypothetical protein
MELSEIKKKYSHIKEGTPFLRRSLREDATGVLFYDREDFSVWKMYCWNIGSTFIDVYLAPACTLLFKIYVSDSHLEESYEDALENYF